MATQSTRSLRGMEAILSSDPLTEALREKVRELIETLIEAEVTEVLAARPYQRSERRRGYRHGRTGRTLATRLGVTRLTLPRARLHEGPHTEEWQSQLLGRYQRRAAAGNKSSRQLYADKGGPNSDQMMALRWP